MGDQWVNIPMALDYRQNSVLGQSVSNAYLFNMMFTKAPPGSEVPYVAISTPLISATVSTAGSGSIRGMIVHGDYVWWVRGATLRTYDGTTVTSVGSIAGTKPVQMVGAGTNQIVIVDGAGNEYKATTGAVTAITPPAGDFSDVTYMDGYTIAIRAGTDEFYISALDDPTTWNALDFSTADAVSDTLIACYVHNRELYLIGKKHTEVWVNTGASPFPFERQRPGVIDVGIFGVGTVAHYSTMMMFVGSDQRVYRMNGYIPEPVSTPDVEATLKAITNDTNIRASFHSDEGQTFYTISLSVGAQLSSVLCYDIESGFWHTRRHTSGMTYVDIAQYRKASGASELYVAFSEGNAATGGIYKLSLSQGTELSAQVDRYIYTPFFSIDGRRFFEHELEIAAAAYNGNYLNGQVSLTCDDGLTGTGSPSAMTITLSNTSPIFPIRFHRLGSAKRRQHVILFVVSQPVIVEALRARISVGV